LIGFLFPESFNTKTAFVNLFLEVNYSILKSMSHV